MEKSKKTIINIIRACVLLCMVLLVMMFAPDESYDICEPWEDNTEERQTVALMFMVWNSIAVVLGAITMRMVPRKSLIKITAKVADSYFLAILASLLTFSVVTTPFVFGMVVLMDNMGYMFAAWVLYSVALIAPIMPSREKIYRLRTIFCLAKYTIIVFVANIPLLIYATSDFKDFMIPGILISLILYGLSWGLYMVLATIKRIV